MIEECKVTEDRFTLERVLLCGRYQYRVISRSTGITMMLPDNGTDWPKMWGEGKVNFDPMFDVCWEKCPKT